MKIINLRLHYPHCQQDKLVEVSEEVKAFLIALSRLPGASAALDEARKTEDGGSA